MSKKPALVRCDCGCTVLSFDEDGGCVYVMAYEDSFYGKNSSKLRRYLNRLWHAIRGREYGLFDIVVDSKEFKEALGKLYVFSENERAED